jgi:hypothetical protein
MKTNIFVGKAWNNYAKKTTPFSCRWKWMQSLDNKKTMGLKCSFVFFFYINLKFSQPLFDNV